MNIPHTRLLLALFAVPTFALAQDAVVRVDVSHAGEAVAGAIVRVGSSAASTGPAGRAALRVAPGTHDVVVRRLGFIPDSSVLTLRAGQDTTITITLGAPADEELLAGVIVSATRSGKRIADEAVRVEVLDREEIEEKVMMTPGDIAMLLNETAGLRVQTTSPSLGGAGVRIQGLGPRYTQILSDGLPLYGGQSGGLSLLQIPPVDLGRVEVIKGSASAMYGAQALGGVINLVSRRADDEATRELLLNRTSRGGTDATLFAAAPFGRRWSGSVLAGGHAQDRGDVDADGWADLPGYSRVVLRPRLFREGAGGSSLFLTGGFTGEDRRGGTVSGRTAPDGSPYVEALDTRRGDVGAVLRMPLRDGRRVFSARGSATLQQHAHTFGARREDDRHRTVFAEATYTLVGDRTATVLGLAYQHDDYINDDIALADFSYDAPALFAQTEVVAARWLTLSLAGRLDAHSEFGTSLSPRLSVLVRPFGTRGTLTDWTVRASAASGVFAPSLLTDESEVVGISQVVVNEPLRFERASTGALDIGGPLGPLEVNATLFASVVRDALQASDAPPAAPGEPPRLLLSQSSGTARTHGTELVARYLAEPWHVTTSWTWVDGTYWDEANTERRPTPLVPRHALGMVAMYEWEALGRIGLEFYYTGEQALEENPYRSESPAYVIVGALAERVVGPVRLFVNLENLTNTRQTATDPLLLPARGRGGRWTTDAWTELSGRTINGGVRWTF